MTLLSNGNAKSQSPLRYLLRSWSPTSFDPDSVMEFGFKQTIQKGTL